MYYSMLVLGATNLGTYSTAKEWLHRRWGLAGVTLTFSSSLAAGLAIASTIAPIDFARSRLMVGSAADGAAGGAAMRSGLHVLRGAWSASISPGGVCSVVSLNDAKHIASLCFRSHLSI